MPQVCAWFENLSQYRVVASIMLGAIFYWSKGGRKGRQSFRYMRSMTQLISNQKWREAVDMAVFVVFGCVVVLLIVEPSTPQQGFAAGAGWTGLLSEVATK